MLRVEASRLNGRSVSFQIFQILRSGFIATSSPRTLTMIFAQFRPATFVIRLEMGDDILGSIKRLAKAKRIRAAMFEGIGSLNKARLGHYDFRTKNYKYELFEEDLEILTLS